MLQVLKATVFLPDTDQLLTTNLDKLSGSNYDWWIIVGCLLIVGVYSTLSGLWGVAITDVVQFIMAMLGCIWLAIVSVKQMGGIGQLQATINALPGGDQAFRFLPDVGAQDAWMPLHLFLILVFMQWWATWYPGAEPGGGGYVVQRMASCKDERHALLATLWFQVAHYCLRPWPWILVAYVAMVHFPELSDYKRSGVDPGIGYPLVIRAMAPPGLRGLLLVAFFAAFMSTISTQMNWGASYLVRDLYQRFLAPNATDRQLTWAARLASVLVLIAGGIAAWWMRGIAVDSAWKLLLALGAGTGAVYILRWFWWRINAWSEIIAMVASLGYYVVVTWIASQYKSPSSAELPLREEEIFAIVAALTIVTWLVGTWLTPPESQEKLIAFYRKIRPGGPGWKPIAAHAPEVIPDRNLVPSIVAAILSSTFVYSVLWGSGQWIFGNLQGAAISAAVAAAAGIGVWTIMQKMGWKNFL